MCLAGCQTLRAGSPRSPALRAHQTPLLKVFLIIEVGISPSALFRYRAPILPASETPASPPCERVTRPRSPPTWADRRGGRGQSAGRGKSGRGGVWQAIPRRACGRLPAWQPTKRRACGRLPAWQPTKRRACGRLPTGNSLHGGRADDCQAGNPPHGGRVGDCHTGTPPDFGRVGRLPAACQQRKPGALGLGAAGPVEGVILSRTPQWRAKGPALFQPRPKRGTSDGLSPDLNPKSPPPVRAANRVVARGPWASRGIRQSPPPAPGRCPLRCRSR